MKKLKTIVFGLALLMMISIVNAQTTQQSSATSVICNVLSSIRTVLYAIAGAIGIVVITLQGVRWTASADDPGARKQAKDGMIHAVVGLIIVLLAVWIIGMVFTNNACPGMT